jgi:hypothetical protein
MALSLTEYRQEIQEKRNWCWAATIQSLVRFHLRNDQENADWSITQCAIAQEVLGPQLPARTTCCPEPGPTPAPWPAYLEAPPGNTSPDTWDDQSPCNVTAPDDPAIQDYLSRRFGITYGYVQNQLPANEIEKQLKAGWPVYVVRGDQDGGTHILAITGIDGDTLTIQDSEGDIKTATFNSLVAETVETRIRTVGRNGAVQLYYWIRTYFHVQSE